MADLLVTVKKKYPELLESRSKEQIEGRFSALLTMNQAISWILPFLNFSRDGLELGYQFPSILITEYDEKIASSCPLFSCFQNEDENWSKTFKGSLEVSPLMCSSPLARTYSYPNSYSQLFFLLESLFFCLLVGSSLIPSLGRN